MQVKSADERGASPPRAILGGPALPPILRMGFFLAAVCIFVSALLLRSVRADVTEALWGIGARTMDYPGAPQEGVRQLQLNGVPVSFRTQTVDAPLVEVLAHYEVACGTAIATQTAHTDSAGYVACLDIGDGSQDLGALVDRFIRFSETGDLQELGNLRYVLARRLASGSGAQTFLLTMWTDSVVDLRRMLPRANEDAAGRDPVGVPRPPSSQRILSAWEARQPSGVFIYRVVVKSAKDLEVFYRSELVRNAWTIIERNPSESIAINGTRLLSAEKDDRVVTVVSQAGEASQTVLTILTSEPP
jgi:hypothetical protein